MDPLVSFHRHGASHAVVGLGKRGSVAPEPAMGWFKKRRKRLKNAKMACMLLTPVKMP
jgi:hypothetical protein